MNNNKYNLIFSSFSAHKPPVFKAERNRDWIMFGDTDGYKNNYPQYLLDNYNKASIHNAIVNGKINYIEGQGLDIINYRGVESLAMAKGFLRNPNSYESSAVLNRKFATDLVLFGGIYGEVIKTEVGNKLSELAHLPFENIRVNKDEHNIFYYTSDWTTKRPEDNEDFKIFYEFEGTFEGSKEYLISKRVYRAGDDIYPLPDYLAANPIIESEWRIDNFHLNNIKSGFSAGYMINFYNGEPTLEDQKQIEKKIKEKFTGDENSGEFILNFTDGKDKAADIIAIPSNSHDERFNTLSNWIVDKLVVAHNIPNPLLLGIAIEGKLGGSTELPISDFLFRANFVRNRQRFLNDFWNDVLALKGISATVEIKENEVYGEGEDINPAATALGALSPLVANKILESMTTAEIRGLIGLTGGLITTKETTATEFCKQDDDEIINEHFSNCGINDDEYELISDSVCDFSSIEDAEQSEMSFATLTTPETSVLSILDDNPAATVQEIADATKLSVKDVQSLIDKMVIDGLLNEGNEVTKEGSDGLNENDVFVVYKYEERPNAPALKGGESRPFCVKMMELSKSRSWTLNDISKLRNGSGLDCFSSRGGWYTKPNTDIRTPQCRHIWKQRLVKRKKK